MPNRRPLTTRALLDPRFEERKERRSSMRGKTERRTLQFERGNVEMRAKPNGTGGTSYRFEGYAAVFDAPFTMWDWWGEEYIEVVNAGAFTRTLGGNPDVPFLIGHNDGGIALARTRSGTMTLSQDSTGLHVLVPAMDGNSPLVQALWSAVDRGDMDEMSCAFVTRQCQWSPDYEQRNMLELDLHRGDVSTVVLGANDATAGASMTKAATQAEATKQRRPGTQKRMPTAPYSAKPGEDNECPQCHSANDADASFCDQCGTAMQRVGMSTADEDETQRCGACQTWNAADAKFCDQCGANIASDGDADNGGSGGYWKGGRPVERRADGEEPDLSDAPDYNPAPHSADGQIQCTNEACTVEGGAMNAADAKYCDQCGGPLYNQDGLMVLDDSGVVEETEGDATLLGSGLPVETLRAQLDLLHLTA